jgi:hypothetical protein
LATSGRLTLGRLEAFALAVATIAAAGILTAGCLADGGLAPPAPSTAECRALWVEHRNSAELLDLDESRFVADCTRPGS